MVQSVCRLKPERHDSSPLSLNVPWLFLCLPQRARPIFFQLPLSLRLVFGGLVCITPEVILELGGTSLIGGVVGGVMGAAGLSPFPLSSVKASSACEAAEEVEACVER